MHYSIYIYPFYEHFHGHHCIYRVHMSIELAGKLQRDHPIAPMERYIIKQFDQKMSKMVTVIKASHLLLSKLMIINLQKNMIPKMKLLIDSNLFLEKLPILPFTTPNHSQRKAPLSDLNRGGSGLHNRTSAYGKIICQTFRLKVPY